MAKKGAMTPNSRKVFDYLKSNGIGVKFTTKEVQEALGFEKPGCVTGSITGLVNKGLAIREKEARTDDEGNTKEVSVFYLTEAAEDYDPDAAEEDE